MPKRLIDAKLAQHIANVELIPDQAGIVLWVLSKTPTVEAVEVVRCKDCKHCYESAFSSTGYRCRIWGAYDTDCVVNPDVFCSYGERRTDG